MTYEKECVIRAILRAKIEEALTAAAQLPEFEGAAAIRLLNQARESLERPRPLRIVATPKFKRSPFPDTAECYRRATDDGSEPPEAA